MTYSTHNFVTGTRLKAADLNDIDTELLRVSTESGNNNSFINNIDNYVAGKLSLLRLTADSDTIYLYYGETLLTSVAVPIDLDDYVPCTGVEIDNITGTIEMLTGETHSFTATRSPSNTSQNLRWELSDISKASILSTGVLTALDVGTVTLTARCGGYTDTATISIKKRVSLTGYVYPCSWVSLETSENRVTYILDSITGAGLMPFSSTAQVIKPGETINISITPLEREVVFKQICVFAPVSGQTISISDERESIPPRYKINNVTVLDYATDIHSKTQDSGGQWGWWSDTDYTYTNNTSSDAYFAFFLQDMGNYWITDSDPQTAAETWFASHVKILIY